MDNEELERAIKLMYELITEIDFKLSGKCEKEFRKGNCEACVHVRFCILAMECAVLMYPQRGCMDF
jgi:hypothetical protein